MKRYFNVNLTWVIPATIAITVFWFVSAVANYQFGISLGSDIFGYASLASDVLKAVALFGVFAAWSAGYRFASVVLTVIWLACTVWSVGSAVGFMSLHYATMTDERGKTADDTRLLRDEIQRLEERREKVASARPASVVKAEIESLLRTPGVDGCSRIDGPVTREICPKIDRLRAELGNAESAMWLDGRLEEKRQEMKASPRVTIVDPRVDTMALIFSASPKRVTLWITAFFGLMLELITALAFWAFWRAFGGHVDKAPSKGSTEARSDPVSLSDHPVVKAARELPARSEMHPAAKISGVEAKLAAEVFPDARKNPATPAQTVEPKLDTPAPVVSCTEKSYSSPILDEPAATLTDAELRAELAKEVETLDTKVVKLFKPDEGGDQPTPPETPKPSRKKSALSPKDERAAKWLRNSVMATGGDGKLTSRDLYNAYEAETDERHRVAKKRLSTLMGEIVIEDGNHVLKDNKGSIWRGYVIVSEVETKAKARA